VRSVTNLHVERCQLPEDLQLPMVQPVELLCG